MSRLDAARALVDSFPPECHATHAELMAAEQPSPYIQGALAVDFSLATDEQVFGYQPTRRADLPEPNGWSAQLARAVVEVLSGTRAPAQLVRWTTPEVHAVIARRHALVQRRVAAGIGGANGAGSGSSARDGRATRPRPAVVRRVVVCEPADGVAEVSVVVVQGGRVRALAMRLVGQDGRWRLTVLHVG